MLVHNKYRSSGSQSQDVERETTAYQIPEADPLPVVDGKGTEDAGCCACGKCYVCKQNFLSFVLNLVAIILNRSFLF